MQLRLDYQTCQPTSHSGTKPHSATQISLEVVKLKLSETFFFLNVRFEILYQLVEPDFWFLAMIFYNFDLKLNFY